MQAEPEHEESGEPAAAQADEEEDSEPLDVKLERISLEDAAPVESSTSPSTEPTEEHDDLSADDGPLYDDPSDEDDGEGELLPAQLIPEWVDGQVGALDELEGYADEAARDESRAWVALLEGNVHAALVCTPSVRNR